MQRRTAPGAPRARAAFERTFTFTTGACLFAAFCLTGAGCTNTPLDVIIADEGGGIFVSPQANPNGVRAGGPAASVCAPTTLAEPGTYQLQLVSQAGRSCLALGDATTVGSADAFDVELAAPCENTAEQLWELEASVVRGSFVVRNLATDLVLDVEKGSVAPLTKVVLFEYGARSNQYFYFYRRTGGFVEIVPAHTVSTTAPLSQPAMCVQGFTAGPAIMPCRDSETQQAWQLVSDACL